MRWEALTSPDFAKAVRDTGVCILPIGVLERHGSHLPLGTDYLNAHVLATLAAEKEPAVVFPHFYFGQIYEALCFPGTVALAPALLLDLLQSVLDEIARNGFRKIILYSGHGGNSGLVTLLTGSQIWQQKPYVLYVPTRHESPERREKTAKLFQGQQVHDHGGESETSITLANFPDMVRMDAVPEKPSLPLNRQENLAGVFTAVGWYANYPDHYAGDARFASAEKGRLFRQSQVDTLADCIVAVKADKVTRALQDEFFIRLNQEIR